MTLIGFMFKNYGSAPHEHLDKSKYNLSKDNLDLQWPLRGTFNLPLPAFFTAKLEDRRSKIKQTEWDSYFSWYLEASKHIQDSKIAFLQNTTSKLTEVN